MVKAILPRPLRWLLLGLAALSGSACMQVLGIDDAHVDPSLSEVGTGGSGNSGGAGSAAMCKHFDNARVTKLMPNGSLAPLPARQ